MPLEPYQYQTGRTVTTPNSEEDVLIVGRVVADGVPFLVIREPDHEGDGIAGLVSEADVRDRWGAVAEDNDNAQQSVVQASAPTNQAYEQRLNQLEDDVNRGFAHLADLIQSRDTGTDGTGGTGSQDTVPGETVTTPAPAPTPAPTTSDNLAASDPAPAAAPVPSPDVQTTTDPTPAPGPAAISQ